MSITTDAIARSSRLSQLGFPEFTVKLLTDTFDAILAANMSQQQAYLDLIKQLSKDMKSYIEDTRDDISGSDILNILVGIAPDINNQTGTFIREDNTATLSSDQAKKINEAVSIPNVNINTMVANTSSQIKDLYKPILEAVASRIAADKYTLLKDMVKLGLVRLVVNNGELQTSLNFETRDNTFFERHSNQFNREEYNFSATASPSSLVAYFVKYAAASRYSKVAVSTVDTVNRNTASNTIQITGSLKLNFSTDYQPLNSLAPTAFSTSTIATTTTLTSP